MARGNDAENAAKELRTQYGDAQNAEELIKARNATRDPDVARASLRPIDQGATDALDLEKLKVGKGERIVAASVRGGVVIAVVEDEDGNTLPKRALELPKDAAKASTLQATTGGPKTAGQPPVSADEQAKAREKAAADKAAEQAKADQQGGAGTQPQRGAGGPKKADADDGDDGDTAAAAAKAAAEQGSPKTAK